jgi:hypothetical protein
MLALGVGLAHARRVVGRGFLTVTPDAQMRAVLERRWAAEAVRDDVIEVRGAAGATLAFPP